MNPSTQSGDKSAAVQTLRASQTPPRRAERLDCGRLQRRFWRLPDASLVQVLKREPQNGRQKAARENAHSTSFASPILAALMLFFAVDAKAETTNTVSDAEIQGQMVVQKILNQQPILESTNLGMLKFKEGNGKSRQISIRFVNQIRPTNWVSIFQGINSETSEADKLWVIHEPSQPNQYAVVHVCGPGTTFSKLDLWRGQLIATETENLVPFCGSDFWLCDLGLEFFHWPQQKVLPNPTNLKRGRSYTLLESTHPSPSTNGYSRVLSWIDKETGGILAAEAYDFSGKLLKEFAPKEFKKVNGQWELQEMEIRNVQTGSRTRLEFDLKK